MRPASSVTSRGTETLAMDDYAHGIVSRGVLLDLPRLRGVPFLEPGDAVTRAELEVLVKETGLDQQLKLLGYWDAWQSGERGRKP